MKTSAISSGVEVTPILLLPGVANDLAKLAVGTEAKCADDFLVTARDVDRSRKSATYPEGAAACYGRAVMNLLSGAGDSWRSRSHFFRRSLPASTAGLILILLLI